MKGKATVAILLPALLVGCMTIQVPVTGQLADGTPMAGEAIGAWNGNGTFFVETTRGLRCSGTYNSLSQSPTLIIPVTCSDGRTGRLLSTRQMDMLSGSAIAELSDGTKGQFVFGNLKFDQAFGPGATVATSRR